MEDPAISLATFTDVGWMLPQLQTADQQGVIHELSRLLHRNALAPDPATFSEAVRRRESLASTAVGDGLAMPHARVEGLERTAFALGRCSPPIPWGGSGSPLVELVFLIAVPSDATTDYLRFMASVARLSKESQLLTNLKVADTSTAMISALKQVKLYRSDAPATRGAGGRRPGIF